MERTFPVDRSFQTGERAEPPHPDDGTASGASETGLVVLAYVAGRSVPVPDEELNAALRRALLVFAAGGGLRRDPTLEDPAVLELARDLDRANRRDALHDALAGVNGAEPLLADPELAWRAYAAGLLAEELGS